MAIVYVNIGSNLGNRESLIAEAIEAIGEKFGYYCLSGCVESEPWGFESTNRFHNIGMAFKSNLEPEEVLRILQSIEKEISNISHRNENGGYKDREIDIDIMAIDNIKYHSPVLTLPHPHLQERYFFRQTFEELKVR